MKKNLLNIYIVNRLRSVEQNLSNYKKDKNPENLHRLRVDIKKIKAIFSFAENAYKEKYDTPKLKPLFQQAGKIREIEINIRLLPAFQSTPKRIIDQLKKKKKILIQQFIKNISSNIKLIKDYSKEVSLPAKLPHTKVIKKYFKKEEQKANKILSGTREDIHTYRIKIKKLMHLYNALPERIQKKIKWDKEKISEQLKKLGNWHDTYSAITFFSHLHFPKKSTEFIIKLKEKEKRQFDALLIK
jgi:CHAD domain-containing protein